MDKDRADKILEKIKIFLIEKLDPQKIILFGSRAKENKRTGSDIDLAILKDKILNFREKRKLKEEIENICGLYSIDLIFLDEVEEKFQKTIEEIGVLIYEKSEVLLALEKLEKAYIKLKEGVDSAKDELDKDGVIQRFEFTFEALWKTLKIYLEYLGIKKDSPRACAKEAFKMGYLEEDEIFLDMMEDRNLSSYIYDEATSNKIYERISKVYVKYIDGVIKNLKNKIGE